MTRIAPRLNFLWLTFGLFWLSALPILAQQPAEPRVLYVKADAAGIGSGASWADAFTDLQDALAAAQSGDEIWVARATYKPTAGTDRNVSFAMKQGVALYGGFSGIETARAQRNWTTNPTILSGDIGSTGTADNSYRVVTGAELAVLDGFTITGADAVAPHAGGGMYNYQCSPTVAHCVFKNNKAGFGGAMYNSGGSPAVSDCSFSANTSASGGGGAIYNLEGRPAFTRCSFSGNTAGGSGGGMFNVRSSPAVADCEFTGNTANTSGGGMYNESSSPTLTNCAFSSNTGVRGGGMFSLFGQPLLKGCAFSANTAPFGAGMFNSGSPAILTDCVFTGNLAGSYGGGIYNASSATPLTNCAFAGNLTTSNGGAIYNAFSSPPLINCVFSGNTAYGNGAGIYNESSSPAFANCDFSRNIAYGNGGGMHNLSGSPTAVNCIFWNNSGVLGAEIYNSAGTPAFRHCDILGCGGSGASWNSALGTDGGGNIAADPRFVSAASPAGPDGRWRTGDDGLRLRPDSPCIGAADPAFAPKTDILGFLRTPPPDTGAYEFGGIALPPSGADPEWLRFE